MTIYPNLTNKIIQTLTHTHTKPEAKNNLKAQLSELNQKLSPHLKVQLINDQYAQISLTRSDKKNAISFSMMKKLITLSNLITKDTSIRAVFLTGDGDGFCSGIDLNDLNQTTKQRFALWELIKPTQSLFQKVCLTWRELPIPVIAVLDGYCIGAGLQLALACDIRISTPNCRFAIMEAKWGLVADMGITQSAMGIVTADVLKELAMSAKTILAEEALTKGLISYVQDNPMEKAINLADEFSQRSPDAVLASKRLINKMYRQTATTLYQEKLWQIKLLLSKNRKIAIKKAKDANLKFKNRQYH